MSGGIFVGCSSRWCRSMHASRNGSTELVAGQGVSSFADRASQLGDALATAVRYQSIENAPMVVFATVGAVLFLFMVRT